MESVLELSIYCLPLSNAGLHRGCVFGTDASLGLVLYLYGKVDLFLTGSTSLDINREIFLGSQYLYPLSISLSTHLCLCPFLHHVLSVNHSNSNSSYSSNDSSGKYLLSISYVVCFHSGPFLKVLWD